MLRVPAGDRYKGLGGESYHGVRNIYRSSGKNDFMEESPEGVESWGAAYVCGDSNV